MDVRGHRICLLVFSLEDEFLALLFARGVVATGTLRITAGLSGEPGYCAVVRFTVRKDALITRLRKLFRLHVLVLRALIGEKNAKRT